MSDDRIARVFRAGLAMEEEGIRTYEAAATRSPHPFARKMFQSLAKDERRHAEWFRHMAEERGVDPAEVGRVDPDGFGKTVRAVFGELRAQIDGMPADADDIRAIDVALGLEEQSYKMYHDAAETASGPDAKALLDLIAREENNHYAILDDAKLYLTDPEKWNIKEENPLIDGG